MLSPFSGVLASTSTYRRMRTLACIVGLGALVMKVSSSPALCAAVTALLFMPPLDAALAGGASPAEAAARSGEDIDPTGDVRATAEYKRHLAEVLTARTLQQATMAA